MTREEAKEMFRNDKDSYGKPRAVMSKIDKIFDEFEKESLDIPDIRNKLSPITTFINIFEEGWGSKKYLTKLLPQCKKSINYLANREVYYAPEVPEFVRLGDSALRYDHEEDNYFRDAGCWSVGYKLVDGKYYSIDNYGDGKGSNLDNVELIPITEKEYNEDNKGYVEKFNKNNENRL